MKVFKYAMRFLMRARSYTLINLLGLAFSLACCIILMRYIHRELTVDTHCVDRNHTYGIDINMEGSRALGGIEPKSYTYDTVNIDTRSIEAMTSYIPLEKDYVMIDEHRFPARCIVTDSVFFQIFRYPLLQGRNSLQAPQSALLTEEFAQRIFGKENPVGKVLRYSNGQDITIEGILGEPACKTRLNFDVVLSSLLSNRWERNCTEIYRFLPGTDIETINRLGSRPRYINDPEYDTRTYTFSLIPIEEIYWDASLNDSEPSMFSSGSRQQITILGGVCLLLLLTGVLNFVNLYMVTMLRRNKEYGLKKVFGASGRDLFLCIWIENMLLVASALLSAWFIIEVTRIPTEHLFGVRFAYTAFDGWLSLGILVCLTLVTSIYPFIKYNYTSPIRSIRSIGKEGRSVYTRMWFLGGQYVLTFLLVVLSLYFNRQLETLLTTEPGFRTKDILNVKLEYESKDFNSYRSWEAYQRRRERAQTLRNEIKNCPLIECLECSYESILTPTFGMYYINEKGERSYLNIRYASPDFFKLYDIKIVEGNIAQPDEDSKSRYSFVANRAAMKALGYTSLGGGIIEENQKKADNNASLQPISAVVEDYYEGHLTAGVTPTIYYVDERSSGDMYQIAYTSGKQKEVLDFLRKLEYKVYGSEDFEYTVLEDDVKAMYAQDRRTAAIYSIFAGIAILVSGLGLLGISLFDIRQRYREIAIRKVNGAGLRDLYLLLFRKYTVTLAGAFVVAIPLSYFLIETFTQDFAVKAPIGLSMFVFSLTVVMAISLGTLFGQVRKAANINPAEIVKNEE